MKFLFALLSPLTLSLASHLWESADAQAANNLTALGLPPVTALDCALACSAPPDRFGGLVQTCQNNCRDCNNGCNAQLLAQNKYACGAPCKTCSAAAALMAPGSPQQEISLTQCTECVDICNWGVSSVCFTACTACVEACRSSWPTDSQRDCVIVCTSGVEICVNNKIDCLTAGNIETCINAVTTATTACTISPVWTAGTQRDCLIDTIYLGIQACFPSCYPPECIQAVVAVFTACATNDNGRACWSGPLALVAQTYAKGGSLKQLSYESIKRLNLTSSYNATL